MSATAASQSSGSTMFPNCHLRLNLCLHFLLFDAVFFSTPNLISGEAAVLCYSPKDSYQRCTCTRKHNPAHSSTVNSWGVAARENTGPCSAAGAVRPWQNVPHPLLKAPVESEWSWSRHSANNQLCKDSNKRQQLPQPHKNTEEEEEEEGSQAAANQITLVAQCFDWTGGIPWACYLTGTFSFASTEDRRCFN